MPQIPACSANGALKRWQPHKEGPLCGAGLEPPPQRPLGFITMSLKFFFDGRGFVVRGLNALGWLLTIYNVWTVVHFPRGLVTQGSFYSFVSLAFLVALINFYPWYGHKDRGHGIENHFSKTLIPLGYILVVANLVFFLWNQAWPFLIFCSLLLVVILAVNIILIIYHFQDKDLTPPSYFIRRMQD